MASGRLYLGLDVGTKNVKAVILSAEDGEVVEYASIPVYDLVIQPRNGFVEREPGRLWLRVAKLLKSMKHIGEVDGVCIDATSGTFLTLGRDGEPLHHLIMYNDSRAVREAEELRRKSRSAREFEMFLPINSRLVLPKLMWLKKNLEGFNHAWHVLHEGDYIAYMLSESIATSANTAGKSHALLDREGYLAEAYDDVGIPVELMPEIRPIGSVIGRVSERGEREAGIPSGTPIANGVTDATAGDITSGALEHGQASITIGTSLTAHVVVDRLAPDPKRRFYYKVYLKGRYLAGGFTNAGTAAIDALARVLGARLQDLTELASSIPPGSEGLIACSELYGVRVPGDHPNVRGFIIGLTERNFTEGHLFRATLESSGYTLRLLLKAVEEVTGTEIRELRVSGGGSRNNLFMQILADITGAPVVAVEEPDSAIGSAIIAAWGIGGEKLENMLGRTVKMRRRFHPNPRNHKIYEEKTEKYRRIIESISKII